MIGRRSAVASFSIVALRVRGSGKRKSSIASAWRAAGYLAVAFIAAVAFLPAAAQDAHWRQLSEQVIQLRQQGRIAEAIPLAQEAVRVAQATFGSDSPRVAVSLTVLGLLEKNQEKFADAESLYRRALSICLKAEGQESANVASILNDIADLYRIQSRYADAEKLFQQALSIHQKVLGADDPAVAVDANNLALVYVSEGKYADAEPLYRRAIAIDQRMQTPEDSGVAREMVNLASLYEKEGKFPDSEQLFLKGIAMDVKTYGNEHPTVANDLNLLSGVYVDEGKYSAAEPVILRAMAIDQKVSSPDSAAVATDLGNLAVLYRDEGRYADAEPLFKRALDNRVKALGPNHPDVATILDSLGALYFDEGRDAEAESLYRRAIDIRQKTLGPNHPQVALSLGNLAELYKEQGKWSDAETLYRNAMTIDLKTLGQENPRVAVLLNNTASLFLEEGRLADAEKLLRGALAIDQKAYGSSNPAIAPSLNLLAEVFEYEGKHADSEALYQQALAIAEKSLGPNHPNVAGDLIGLAADYEDDGKYPQAEPLFRRALAIYENSFGPDHPNTGEAQMNLAVLYYGWDKPELAGPYFDKRLGNLIDQFRSNASYMSEKDRLMFLGTVPGAFPLFFSFALKYHDRDPALARKVYDLLLQEKGFIAASAAALRAKILASGDKDTLALLDKLTAKKTQLASLVSSTQGDPQDRRKQIAELSQEANQIEQEIVKRSSALAEDKTLSAVTWRDVQKALKPGEAAVEIERFQFHNGKSFTSAFYYIALVVTPASRNPNFIVLGEAQKLESAPMGGYRASVGLKRGFSAEAAPGELTMPGSAGANTTAAYEAFWKPLEPALANTKRVYVSPDGVLNQIPIGLLADSNGNLLLEKYDLRTVNSTKDILRPRHAASLKTATLVGNPKFDLTEVEQRAALAALKMGVAQPSQPAASPHPVLQSERRSGDYSGGPLNPLPGTQVEVNAIGKLLSDSAWQVAPFTGDRALKEVVLRLRSPRIVHFATHGFFLTDRDLAQKSQAPRGQHAAMVDPMLRSGLFFAGANRTQSGSAPVAGLDDGVMTAFEASQLNLEGTELVVLSACETGLGQQSNGEGVFGLRRGLQEAGADAVMMSMWSVPDQETQELMALFYAKWLGGLDKPEALRQAQLNEREIVRQRYGKDLPFYWGAFVLVSR
jgi:CHAT domain-containing protein/Tfp pilus assembly protein PilF